MAGKTKTTAKNTGAQSASTDQFDADVLTNGFEQAFSKYGDVAAFGKENYQTFLEFGNAAKSGLEVLQGEALAFSKKALEDSASVAEASIQARTIQELVEIQSDFAKTAFETYVGQMNKLAGIISETSREAFEPLNNRMTDVLNKVQA